MKINYRTWPAVTITVLMLSACATDEPIAPGIRTAPVLRRGALLEPSSLVTQALRGVRVRGEQDDMLRREAVLPGFGGFYIDSLDHMVVYMKSGSIIPIATVRQVLVAAYSSRPEPRIQALMPEVANARIVSGDFSLSELIAIENRISQSTVRIPGFTGVGTSLAKNRVVVGFLDAADVDAGLTAIQSMRIPVNAIVGEVWGPIQISSSFDQAAPTNPTRGGLHIELHNSTQYPWVGNPAETRVEECSLNFNARWRPSGQNTYTDYMVTAAHCANEYRGINGVTGDTVFQPKYPNAIPQPPPMTQAAGFVAVNPPWQAHGPGCDTNPRDSTALAFCIDGDVMLVSPAPGISTERKLATSQYEGDNGNIGSMQINNYYLIQSVVTPEWVSQRQYGVAKSGAITGTTAGQIDLTVTQIYSFICWANSCPGGRPPGGGGIQVAYYNVAKVLHADWGFGDSGGVVFAGNSGGGAPYVALGIQVAGVGQVAKVNNKSVCVAGTGCAFFFIPWADMQQSIIDQLGAGTLNPVTTQ